MRILTAVAMLAILAPSLPAQERVPSTLEKTRTMRQIAPAELAVVPTRVCQASLPNISCGAFLSDSLSPASCYVDATRGRFYVDGYRFSVSVVTNIDIQLSSLLFDATLVLIHETAGGLVTIDDDDNGGGGTNARIRRFLNPGTYNIAVTTAQPSQTGGYTLTFSCFSASSCTTTPIQCGARFTDTLRNDSCLLGDGSYYTYYSFQGTAGNSVTINMTSTAVDPYLFLLPPTGATIEDNNSGGGTAARIQTTLLETGRYLIAANSFRPDNVGTFDLNFECQGGSSTCTPGTSTLCLDDFPGDRRYKVEVRYQTTQGAGSSGNGRAIQTNSLGISRGGLFWFFAADNPELLIKVLDGCGINGRKWVFYAAGTNVGMDIAVTDTRTGATKTYTNPDRQVAQPLQDANALPCP